MEKRYQVFISSTYQDLQNARQEVSQALLRADCFPAGMELFPAADEEQFEFIKSVIDQSDYYIIISAGRYGSIHPETGLSYTEMEYDYAVKVGKPVIRLLHKDPTKELKGEFIEQSDEGREHLERFRLKLRIQKLVRFWSSPSELGAEVLYSLLQLFKTRPAVGWIRNDGVSYGEEVTTERDIGVPARDNHPEVDLHEVYFDDAKNGFSGLAPILFHFDLPKSFENSKVTKIFRDSGNKVWPGDPLWELAQNDHHAIVKAENAGYCFNSVELGQTVQNGYDLGFISKTNPVAVIGL